VVMRFAPTPTGRCIEDRAARRRPFEPIPAMGPLVHDGHSGELGGGSQFFISEALDAGY